MIRRGADHEVALEHRMLRCDLTEVYKIMRGMQEVNWKSATWSDQACVFRDWWEDGEMGLGWFAPEPIARNNSIHSSPALLQ